MELRFALEGLEHSRSDCGVHLLLHYLLLDVSDDEQNGKNDNIE